MNQIFQIYVHLKKRTGWDELTLQNEVDIVMLNVLIISPNRLSANPRSNSIVN